MPKKTLGLDIGGGSIKATVVEGGFRNYQVTDYVQIDLPEPPAPVEIVEAAVDEALDNAAETPQEPEVEKTEGADEEPSEEAPDAVAEEESPYDRALAQALARLKDEHMLDFDEVVVAAPSTKVLHRLIRLPFVQRKKISMVIHDELDETIPFEADQLHLDYQIVESGDGASTILAGMIEPKVLQSFLETLKEGGLEPRVVDLKANALACVAATMEEQGDDPVSVVDIGSGTTTVVLMQAGRIKGLRTLATGGKHITATLAEGLGVSVQEAERIKLEQGIPAVDSEAPGGRLPDAMQAATQTLRTGLLQTFHAFEMETSLRSSRMLLCGGAANTKGMEDWLAEVLEIPVRRMLPLEDGIARSIPTSEEQQAGMVVSLGLALRPYTEKNRERINFRSGAFSYRKGAKQFKTNLRQVAIMGAVLFILLCVQAFLKYQTYSGQANKIDNQIRQIYTKVFPGQVPVNPTQQFMNNIQSSKEKIAILGGLGETGVTALGVLRELSTKIPRTVKIDVNKLELSNDVLRIEGLTDDFNSVDRIETELGKFDGFVSIKKDSATKTGGDKIKFKFTISLVEGKTQAGVIR